MENDTSKLLKACMEYRAMVDRLETENAALNHALNIAQTELRLNGCAKAADEVAKLHDAARKEAQP